MAEQEYIVIETRIRKTSYGTERKDKLIAMSNPIDMTPEFKDILWNDYGIDIDELEEEAGENNIEITVEI